MIIFSNSKRCISFYLHILLKLFFRVHLIRRSTVWLNGSGGTSETPYQLSHILANRASTSSTTAVRLKPVLGLPGIDAHMI